MNSGLRSGAEFRVALGTLAQETWKDRQASMHFSLSSVHNGTKSFETKYGSQREMLEVVPSPI